LRLSLIEGALENGQRIHIIAPQFGCGDPYTCDSLGPDGIGIELLGV